MFSSINYGTDTSSEGRCIIRELLNSTYEGVGNNATAIFPIQIMKVKSGVNLNPEDPNYDLYKFSWRVTARRFFPNYLNLDSSYNFDEKWNANDPKRYMHEVASMGCRTRVYADRFGEKTSVGRGNLSFTTINLVKIAINCMKIESQTERIERFFTEFEKYLEIAATQLIERYNFQKQAVKKQFPLLMSGMWKGSEKLESNDCIGNILKTGTLSIGFIGLAETLIALTGKHHGENDESQKLGLRIIEFMRKKVDEFANRFDKNFTLLATPAEGLSGTFTKKDKKEFGIIPGITDKEYYTNSSHVPVYFKCTPKHKAEIEGPYHKYENAGHIFYVEADTNIVDNPEVVDAINKIAIKNDIGYWAINHFQSRCPICNFESLDSSITECPHDHVPMDNLQRITGYLVGTTDRWNSGKLAELKDRIQHT